MSYQGDIDEDATLTFWWNTNAADGSSITRATDGTIKVRRDDGTDCTGTSVTDTEDTPDTGIHECKIDTSDSANYATGYDYLVWIDGAVIDGETVNACIATFSIQNRFMRGTDGANTTTPPTASAIVNEWETQSQADPTGFHVNVKEVNGTSQTANDNGADINTALTNLTTLLTRLSSARAGYIDELEASNIPSVTDNINTIIQKLQHLTSPSGTMSGTPSTTQFASNLNGYGNDYFNGMHIIINSGAVGELTRRITDYVSATGTFTVDPALPSAPGSGDGIMISRAIYGQPQSSSEIETAVANILDTAISSPTAGSILDLIQRISGLVGLNVVYDDYTFDGDGNQTAGKIYCYDTKVNADNHVEGSGAQSGCFAVIDITGNYTSAKPTSIYKTKDS